MTLDAVEQVPILPAVDPLDPERILGAKQQLELVRQVFQHDELESRFLELRSKGMQREEIARKLGLEAAESSRVQKRIQRALAKGFPEGKRQGAFLGAI